jgi:2,3-bisphosphoglycerate-dependent phosphoglycerate mutase
MELYLIRHGQSTNNALEDWTRRVEDPLLTECGERQAERVAAHLAAGRHLLSSGRPARRPQLDRLYVSPMIRAMQTAHPIAAALDLAPEVWPDIHEVGGIYLDHGERKVGYPGRTRGELAARFPRYVLPDEIAEDGWWKRDFEETHQGHARAARVAARLQRLAHEDVRVALVSHGDFLSALLHALGRQEPATGAYFAHRNTGVTHVDLTARGVVVHYLNRYDHLDEALLTS